VRRVGDELSLTRRGRDVDAWIPRGTRRCPVMAIAPAHETLEDLFSRVAGPTAAPEDRAAAWTGGAMIGRIWRFALNTSEAARIRVLYGDPVLVIGSNLLRSSSAASLRDADRSRRCRSRRDLAVRLADLDFLGVFLLYTEVQRRTIHAIVSKPISGGSSCRSTRNVVWLSVLVGVFAVRWR